MARTRARAEMLRLGFEPAILHEPRQNHRVRERDRAADQQREPQTPLHGERGNRRRPAPRGKLPVRRQGDQRGATRHVAGPDGLDERRLL